MPETSNSLTTEMLRAAKEAGASGYFMAAAAADPEALEIDENYVAVKLISEFHSADGDPARMETALSYRSGDFVGNLFDGNLAEALYRADTDNMRLLVRLFSEDLMLSELAAERGSEESARRWLEPNLDRYGLDSG